MSKDPISVTDAKLEKPDNPNDLLGTLDYYLGTYAQSNSALRNTSQLDGFCAALACSPVIIRPELWINEVWGGQSYAPEWDSAKDAQEFHNMLLAFYNHVVKDVGNGEYHPLFDEQLIDGKHYEIVHPWCKGFNAGSQLWLSHAQTPEVMDLLVPMQTLGTDGELKLSKDELSALKRSVLPNVLKLHQYFEAQQKRSGKPAVASATLVHDAPKTGRNDPCPCGSGKKYKKCCLQ